jgi:hypothetical protein
MKGLLGEDNCSSQTETLMKITGSVEVLLIEFGTKVNEKSGFLHQGAMGFGRTVTGRSVPLTVSLCASSLFV